MAGEVEAEGKPLPPAKRRTRTWLMIGAGICALIPSALFYLGAFAPITSERGCSLGTKLHFGVMLRCSRPLGFIKEWNVYPLYKDEHASAVIWGPWSGYEAWDVWLDGRYF